MSTMRTTEWAHTLPPTPISEHLQALHVLLIYRGADDYALDAAEHHLTEIARATALVPACPTPIPERPSIENIGVGIENIGEKIRNAFAGVEKALARMKAPRTLEDQERLNILRYERKIAEERKAGLAFVNAKALIVRKELGL